MADEGYLSPPSSRRTSEATREPAKLPSIAELDKRIISDMSPTEASPTKRDSITLATIPEENVNPHHQHLAFPPLHPGSSFTAISKGRSNSYPPSHSDTFPPPPVEERRQSNDPAARPMARALEHRYNTLRPFIKDYEIVPPTRAAI
jgi:hypothetical protein